MELKIAEVVFEVVVESNLTKNPHQPAYRQAGFH
jgi:hypothetical protein